MMEIVNLMIVPLLTKPVYPRAGWTTFSCYEFDCTEQRSIRLTIEIYYLLITSRLGVVTKYLLNFLKSNIYRNSDIQTSHLLI